MLLLPQSLGAILASAVTPTSITLLLPDAAFGTPWMATPQRSPKPREGGTSCKAVDSPGDLVAGQCGGDKFTTCASKYTVS